MINGFPAAIQNVIEQQNYLETRLRRSLHAKYVLRAAAAQKSLQYFDGRIGETKTFTRSNPIAPNITPLNPANNTGLDNGVVIANRGFEQWVSQLYEWPSGLNLNVLGQETLLGDLFVDNLRELAEQAANSLEVVCLQRALTAYDSGDTFMTAQGSGTSLRVDNLNGFMTQYPAANLPSYGVPQPVSPTNPLPVMFVNGTTQAFLGYSTVIGFTTDVVNLSYMQTGGISFGQSGSLVLSSNPGVLPAGTRVVSMDVNTSQSVFNPTFKDGSYVVRPINATTGYMEGSAYNMTISDIFVPTIQITQAVALLSRRQVPRLRNGLYGCAIDATILPYLYQDVGFRQATSTRWEQSPVFTRGIVAAGWGVEFIEASQLPVYAAPNGGFPLRHAFVFGEDVISEHPFAAARNARNIAARQGDIVDVRWVDNVEFINQAPLDRLNEVVKMSYKYVGDFQPGTDKGSNPPVVFTSDWCRYKRGELIQVASPI